MGPYLIGTDLATGETAERALGRRMRKARKVRGMSQAQMADALGRHVNSVSRWELGQRAPNVTEIAGVAKVLRFPVEFFFGAQPVETSSRSVPSLLQDRAAFWALIETIQHWDDGDLHELTAWCAGYERGKSRADQIENIG